MRDPSRGRVVQRATHQPVGSRSVAFDDQLHGARLAFGHHQGRGEGHILQHPIASGRRQGHGEVGRRRRNDFAEDLMVFQKSRLIDGEDGLVKHGPGRQGRRLNLLSQIGMGLPRRHEGVTRYTVGQRRGPEAGDPIVRAAVARRNDEP